MSLDPQPALTRSAAPHSFWVFWAATAASTAGTAVTGVALPLTAILVLHVSSSGMGLLVAAGDVAWLLIGLPAGVIVQRFALRRMQVTMDLIRLLAIGSIPVAWWLGALGFAQMIVVALIVSFCTVLFDVANSTFLPAIIPDEELQSRNGVMSATVAAGQLGGPSAGGVLVQLLGGPATLVVDAVSYLASGALLRTLPDVRGRQAPAAATPMAAMIAEGWRHVTRNRVMATTMWTAAVINFVCGGQLALFALYLVHDLDVPAGAVGFLLAADAFGALVFATVTARLVTRFGSARLCVGAAVLATVGSIVLPLGHGPAGWLAFVIGTIVFAGGVTMFSTATRTYRQIATPPELLSRVMATVRFVSWGAIPVGGLVAGVSASGLGNRGALLALAGVTALAPLLLVSSPLRRLRDLPGRTAARS